MKRCRHNHSSPLILGLLCNHVTRILVFVQSWHLQSWHLACCVFVHVQRSLLCLQVVQSLQAPHQVTPDVSFYLSSILIVVNIVWKTRPARSFLTLAFDLLIFWMSQIRPLESDIPNQTSEQYISSDFRSFLFPLSLLGASYFPHPLSLLGASYFPHPLGLLGVP